MCTESQPWQVYPEDSNLTLSSDLPPFKLPRFASRVICSLVLLVLTHFGLTNMCFILSGDDVWSLPYTIYLDLALFAILSGAFVSTEVISSIPYVNKESTEVMLIHPSLAAAFFFLCGLIPKVFLTDPWNSIYPTSGALVFAILFLFTCRKQWHSRLYKLEYWFFFVQTLVTGLLAYSYLYDPSTTVKPSWTEQLG